MKAICRHHTSCSLCGGTDLKAMEIRDQSAAVQAGGRFPYVHLLTICTECLELACLLIADEKVDDGYEF